MMRYMFFMLLSLLSLPLAMAQPGPLAEERDLLVELSGIDVASPDSLVVTVASAPHTIQLGDDFVIVLTGHDADTQWLQYDHETMHVMVPGVYDFYFEGLATLFAQHRAADAGRDWAAEMRSLMANPTSMHTQSYLMMSEMEQAIGRGATWRLVRYVAGEGRRHVEADGWLTSISPTQQRAACAIIERYAAKQALSAEIAAWDVTFMVPGPCTQGPGGQ